MAKNGYNNVSLWHSLIQNDYKWVKTSLGLFLCLILWPESPFFCWKSGYRTKIIFLQLVLDKKISNMKYFGSNYSKNGVGLAVILDQNLNFPNILVSPKFNSNSMIMAVKKKNSVISLTLP